MANIRVDSTLYQKAKAFQTSIQGSFGYNPTNDNLHETLSYAICRETGMRYSQMMNGNENPENQVGVGLALLDKAAMLLIAGERTREKIYECGACIWEALDIADNDTCPELRAECENLGYLGYFLKFWGD